jgi:hypothetical protein
MFLRTLTRFTQSLLLIAATAMPLHAAQLLDDYYAYIGEDDLYNSNGSRLTQAWQIIRQDRANYHRFGIRQSGDQGDTFFASKNNRATAEQMLLRGSIERSAARRLVRGGVTIHVEIYGTGSRGHFINVTVLP